MECNVEACSRIPHTQGMCHAHWRRARDGRTSPRPLRKQHNSATKACGFEECPRIAAALGLCMLHYKRQRAGSPMDRPVQAPSDPNNPSTWTRLYTVDGYIVLKRGSVNRSSILEHRHVMSVTLGRDLLPHENVHHINGVKDDNRPENLELWSTSQPAGQRVADKIRWARELLETYKGFEVSA